jgi:hypothetical protein
MTARPTMRKAPGVARPVGPALSVGNRRTALKPSRSSVVEPSGLGIIWFADPRDLKVTDLPLWWVYEFSRGQYAACLPCVTDLSLDPPVN